MLAAALCVTTATTEKLYSHTQKNTINSGTFAYSSAKAFVCRQP